MYDNTVVIQASIDEVVETLYITLALVVFTVFIFQNNFFFATRGVVVLFDIRKSFRNISEITSHRKAHSLEKCRENDF